MAPRAYAGGSGARYTILISSLGLMLMGLVMIYSASSASDYITLGDSAYHLKRQLMWMGIGAVIMIAAMNFDYHKLKNLSWPVLGVSIAGLVLALAMGVERMGAQRWIELGGNTIQPSEYAKLSCVMIAALLLTQRNSGRLRDKDMWGRLFMAVGAVVLLVMLQPDMGTTMSIVFAVFVVLLVGGVEWKALAGLATMGAALAALGMLAAPYRAARFFSFIDPWADPQGAGYQGIQAMLAFGSGGITGLGLGMSRQKFFYLPAAHTDFIFAIIGEELGLLGTLAIVLGFVAFAYAGIRIAIGTKDMYGRLLAAGVTAIIVVQALMNMAAVTSLMPITGIPMPLVSFGGSSMTFSMLCVGIVLSVSKYGTRGVRVYKGGAVKKGSGSARTDERRGNRRSHLSGIDGGRISARKRA